MIMSPVSPRDRTRNRGLLISPVTVLPGSVIPVCVYYRRPDGEEQEMGMTSTPWDNWPYEDKPDLDEDFQRAKEQSLRDHENQET